MLQERSVASAPRNPEELRGGAAAELLWDVLQGERAETRCGAPARGCRAGARAHHLSVQVTEEACGVMESRYGRVYGHQN